MIRKELGKERAVIKIERGKFLKRKEKALGSLYFPASNFLCGLCEGENGILTLKGVHDLKLTIRIPHLFLVN